MLISQGLLEHVRPERVWVAPPVRKGSGLINRVDFPVMGGSGGPCAGL